MTGVSHHAARCRVWGPLNGSVAWLMLAAYRGRMTTYDASDLGPHVWRGNSDDYDDWINDLLRDCPEVWEASEGSADSIVTSYVRHLERMVTSAYGAQGLEPDREGLVADTADMWRQMNALRDWMTKNMPHVNTDKEGVAGPVIRLLSLTLTAVQSILPVFTSIVSTLEPQFRALGLYRKSR